MYRWEYCPSIEPMLCFRQPQLSCTPEEYSILQRSHTIRPPWRNCRNRQLQILEDVQKTRCNRDLWKENRIIFKSILTLEKFLIKKKPKIVLFFQFHNLSLSVIFHILIFLLKNYQSRLLNLNLVNIFFYFLDEYKIYLRKNAFTWLNSVNRTDDLSMFVWCNCDKK